MVSCLSSTSTKATKELKGAHYRGWIWFIYHRRWELGEGGKTSQLDKQSKWNKRAEANELPALEAALVLRPVLWSTVLPGEQLHLSARAELPRNPRKKWLVRESLTEVP